MFRLRGKKGQSGLELGLLLVMAIIALVALQHYFKKAYEGRLKSASDDVGSPFSSESTTGSVTTTMNSTFTTNDTTTSQNTVYDEHTPMFGH